MSAKNPDTLAELEKLVHISDEEEAALQAAIASDPDDRELTDEEWARVEWRSCADGYPEILHGVKPRYAQSVIEQARKTEPEAAREMEEHNRQSFEAERKYKEMHAAQGKIAAAE